MKRTAAFLAAPLCLTLVLAGCSASDPETSDGRVHLTFWHGYTESDGDVLNQIVDDFNASQDDVAISTEVNPWDVIDDTVLPALSAPLCRCYTPTQDLLFSHRGKRLSGGIVVFRRSRTGIRER